MPSKPAHAYPVEAQQMPVEMPAEVEDMRAEQGVKMDRSPKKGNGSGPRLPAPVNKGGMDAGSAPIGPGGAPAAIPTNVTEPNRRDLDPGG